MASSSSPSSSPSSTVRRSKRLSSDTTSSSLPLAHFVTGVVDRSGSMHSMGGAPSEQMHSQMGQLKDEAEKTGVSTHLTIVTFDNSVEVFMDNVQLDDNDGLPSYVDFQRALHPRGTTRFYDTVYEAIDALERRRDEYTKSLSPLVKRLNPKVMCSLLVLTDGADNASMTHTSDTVATRLIKARANGVNAIFLAANIDASTEGAALGFAKQATVQMSASYAGASACMRTVSNGLRQATSGNTSMDYNQACSQNPDISTAAPVVPRPSLRASGGGPPPMPPMPLLRRY
jgi:uncharacterized protein YegL